jgi:hypothetical protein
MEAVQTANPPTFESVMAILDRVSKKQEDLVESQKETWLQMKESEADFDTGFGSLTNLFGKIAEYMVGSKMRIYANLHGDNRAFLGAVTGVVVTDELKNYALNQGFFVIEPVGENFFITPPNGRQKEW